MLAKVPKPRAGIFLPELRVIIGESVMLCGCSGVCVIVRFISFRECVSSGYNQMGI